MSLNETLPTDDDLFSTYAGYIRETREALNAIIAVINGQIAGVESVGSISAETLAAGVEMIQMFFIDVSGTITYISGGSDGQQVIIKIKAGRSVTVSHSGAETSGDINLDGDGNDFSMEEYDMLHLVNVGGDPSLGIQGYWAELSRSLWL